MDNMFTNIDAIKHAQEFSKDLTPEQARAINKYSNPENLNPSFVETNLQELNVQEQDLEAFKALRTADPLLYNYLMVPLNYGASRGEIDKLSTTSRLLYSLPNTIGNQLRSDEIGREKSLRASLEIEGKDTSLVDMRISALENSIDETSPKSWVEGVLTHTPEILTQVADISLLQLPVTRMLQGAGLSLPMAGALVAAGAVTGPIGLGVVGLGLAAGYTLGVAENMKDMLFGEIYENARQVEGVTPEQAAMVANTLAWASGGLEIAQNLFFAAGKNPLAAATIKKVRRAALTVGLKKPVVKLLSKLTSFGTKFATTYSTEVGLELTQNTMETGGKVVAELAYGTGLQKETWDEFVEMQKEGVYPVMTGMFGVTAFGMGATSVGKRLANYNKDKSNSKKRNEAINQVLELKSLNSENQIKKFFNALEMKHVYVDTKELSSLDKDKVDAVIKELNIVEDYSRALETGEKVKVPIELYFQKMKDKSLENYVNSVITFAQSDRSDAALKTESPFLDAELSKYKKELDNHHSIKEELRSLVDFKEMYEKGEVQMYGDLSEFMLDVLSARYSVLKETLPNLSYQDYMLSLDYSAKMAKKIGVGSDILGLFSHSKTDGVFDKISVTVKEKGLGNSTGYGRILVHELMHFFDYQLEHLAENNKDNKKLQLQLKHLNQMKTRLQDKFVKVNKEYIESMEKTKKGEDYILYLTKPNEIIARAAELGMLRTVSNNNFVKGLFHEYERILLSEVSSKTKDKIFNKEITYEGLDTKKFFMRFFFDSKMRENFRNMVDQESVNTKEFKKLAKTLGVKPEQLYAKVIKAADKATVDKMLSEYRSERRQLAKALDEVQLSKPLRALNYIVKDDIKFNDAVFKEQHQGFNIPSNFLTDKKSDTTLSDVANMFDIGINELIEALNTSLDKEGKLKEKTVDALISKFGVNEAKIEQLVLEIAMLQQTLGFDVRETYNKLKSKAKLAFSKLNLNEAKNSEYHAQNFAEYGIKASEFLSKQDFRNSLDLKTKQIYAYYYLLESINLKDKLAKFERSRSTFFKYDEANMKAMTRDFFLAVAKLYEKMGLSSDKWMNTISQFKFAEFHKAYEKLAVIPEDFSTFLDTIQEKFEDINVQDFNHFNNMINQLKRGGRNFNKVLKQGKQAALNEIIENTNKELDGVKDKQKRAQGMGADFVTSFTSALSVLHVLKEQGATKLYDFVVGNMMNATGEYNKYRTHILKSMQDINDKYLGKDWASTRGKQVYTINGVQFNMIEIMEIVKHLGNEENFSKLKQDDRLKKIFEIPDAPYSFFNLLTSKEMSYVKAELALIEEYGKLSQQALIDTNEYVPPLKQLKSWNIKTKDGMVMKYDGGYYPLRRSNEKSYFSINQGANDFYRNNQDIFTPMNKSFHQKDMSKGSYKIDLNRVHASRVLLDSARQAAYRAVINDINKVLGNQDVLVNMHNKFSVIDAPQVINDWTQNLIGNNMHMMTDAGVGKLLDRSKNAVILQQIGFKITTAILQASGLITGALWTKAPVLFMKNMYGFISNPGGYYTRANEYSNVLRARNIDLNRNINDIVMSGDLLNYDSFWRKAAFAMNRGIDSMVSSIVFNTAYEKTYNKLIQQGVDASTAHTKAVVEGDVAISMTQGSGSEVTLSALFASKNPMLRLLTTFGTWGNTLYNMAQATTGYHKLMIVGTIMFVLPLFEEVVREGWGLVRDFEEEPEETIADKAPRFVGNIAQTVPLLGNLIYSITHRRDLTMPAFKGLTVSGEAFYRIPSKLYKGKELTFEDWSYTLLGAGNAAYIATGNAWTIPPAQFINFANNLYNMDDKDFRAFDEKIYYYLGMTR